MSMIDRFTKGKRAKEYLVETLCKQEAINGNKPLSRRLAAVVTVLEYSKGYQFITQGGEDNDLYFILHGRVRVVLHDFWKIAERQQGSHVGEMALIDKDQPRSTSVVAVDDVVLARVSEPDFSAIAKTYPELWRSIACVLTNRLRERGHSLLPPNKTPSIFIGSASSKSALAVMREIEKQLSGAGHNVHPWTDNVFKPGSTTIETLFRQLNLADMAIMVATPEDLLARNKKRVKNIAKPVWVASMRDNVLFELGLFMGRLGKERAFLVHPKAQRIHIPTDLLGVTTLPYDSKKIGSSNISEKIKPICAALITSIKENGPMQRLKGI